MPEQSDAMAVGLTEVSYWPQHSDPIHLTMLLDTSYEHPVQVNAQEPELEPFVSNISIVPETHEWNISMFLRFGPTMEDVYESTVHQIAKRPNGALLVQGTQYVTIYNDVTLSWASMFEGSWEGHLRAVHPKEPVDLLAPPFRYAQAQPECATAAWFMAEPSVNA